MREMKDSGIEWIGEIPNNWELRKIKQLPDRTVDNSYVDGDWIESPDVADEGIRYLTTGNIGDGYYKEQGSGYVTLETFKRLNCKYAYPGDLVISRLNAPYGRACILPNEFSEYVLAVDNVILRPTENKKYLCYVMQCEGYHHSVEDQAKGTTMKRISRTNLGNITLPIPTIKQQEKIADFLDSKCTKIDEIISKQEQIIEKLKEYKLSVITEAVTKGLDPSVEMKDSGAEWLGMYPAHWKYLSFRNVLTERNEKNIPVQTDERLSLSIDKGVTLYAEKTTNLDRFKDDVSQYKLAHEGDLVMNSMNMIVGAIGVSNYFGCVSPAYYTYYDDVSDHITARFCDYLLRCKTMRKVLHSLGKGILSIDRGDDRINTCRLKVSRTDLRSLKIPLPPIDEQRRIVEHIYSIEKRVDKTIADREKAVTKLQEYKKSLVYEVVTGKKEV